MRYYPARQLASEYIFNTPVSKRSTQLWKTLIQKGFLQQRQRRV